MDFNLNLLREGLLVLCTYWHEKNGFEDSHQYSSHSRLTRCCQVHFKTPQVKSFFSQHDHFEYSQIAVKQDVQEEEALVTGDYWQVDPLRRELIRHHKDKRRNLHEMNRSDETSIPKDQLLDERERHIKSSRRARRRFFTRTTGVKRGRGFLTRAKSSGRARPSTRSRRTT